MSHPRRGSGAYFTSVEAAEHLNVSEGTLRVWRSKKQGPPYHKIGRRVFYDVRDLDAWDAERREYVSA